MDRHTYIYIYVDAWCLVVWFFEEELAGRLLVHMLYIVPLQEDFCLCSFRAKGWNNFHM